MSAYGKDWDEEIGKSLNAENEEYNKKMNSKISIAKIELTRAEIDSGQTLTLDQKIKISPLVFGVIL